MLTTPSHASSPSSAESLSPTLTLSCSLIAGALLALCAPAQAATSNSTQLLPPMHLPFKADQTWRVGNPQQQGGFFGEGQHRNRNPDAHFNEWNDYYATDWNNSQQGSKDQPVFPVADGVVVESRCDFTVGYGCSVVLDHGLGTDAERFRTRYAHLHPDSVDLFPLGAYVRHWQQIGRVSNTSKDPHLLPHLHLSALSAERENDQLRFVSNCARGQQTGRCDNGELHLGNQSRSIGRVLTKAMNGAAASVNVGGGMELTSSNQPTLYFAGLPRNAASRQSTIQISNAHVNPANPQENNAITVKWYDRWGVAVSSQNLSLAPHASISLNTPGIVGEYSAIITAEAGKDIAGMATLNVSYPNLAGQNRVAYSAMESISQARSSQVIPLWHKANYGWGSVVRVFNPGAEPIKFDLRFNAAGLPAINCSQTYAMAGYETKSIDTSTISCLPDGRYGSASLRSYYVDANQHETGPALSAASYEQYYLNSSNGERSIISSSASQETLHDVGSNQYLFAPVVQNNNYGWFSGLAAERLEGNGNLLLEYYDAGGNYPPCLQQNNGGVWPYVQVPLVPAGSNCSAHNLAAKISAEANGTQSGVRYVSAQINQLNAMNASGYPAIAAPGTRVYVPLLKHNAQQTSGIQLQNTAANSAAQISIIYYDVNRVASPPQVINIPANGFVTLPSTAYPFPTDVLNAEITSSTPLAAVVNIVQTQGACSDCILSYVPETRN